MIFFGPNDDWAGVWLKDEHGTCVIFDVRRDGMLLHDKTNFLFVTHSHLDHCSVDRISADKYLMTRYCFDFLSSDIVRRRWRLNLNECAVDTFKYDNSVDLGSIEVTPIPVHHSCPYSSAFYVECDDSSILITGDWNDPIGFKVIEEMASYEPDIIITECTRGYSSVPDTKEENLLRIEWAIEKFDGNFSFICNPQHVELVRLVKNVFGEVYVSPNDPLFVACDLVGISVKKYDGYNYPLVTSSKSAINEDVDVVMYEYRYEPTYTKHHHYVRVSLGGHACFPEIRWLVELSNPGLVVLHHSSYSTMVNTKKKLEKLTGVNVILFKPKSISDALSKTVAVSDGEIKLVRPKRDIRSRRCD